MYINRDQAESAIKNMKRFYQSLRDVYAFCGMNIEEDLGRRNILMSGPQEFYFAEQIKSNFPSAYNNGKTGEPDIVIPEIEKNLECKLTTRHRSGALSFQSDSMTFKDQEDGVDFLYAVADDYFESFAVLHFEGLVRDDFHLESPGARGRVRMKKHIAMRKCNVLMGDVIDRRDGFIERYTDELSEVKQSLSNRIFELNHRMQHETPAKARKTAKTIDRETARFGKKIDRIKEKISTWKSKNPSYTVILEDINGDDTCQNLIYAT
jgi:hypothetical protein